MKDDWRKRVKTKTEPITGRNWWNAAKAIALLVSFIALAFWLEHVTGKAISHLESVPYHYWWWGLGITGGVALLAGLLWSPARRSYTGGAMRSRWLWWPVVILLFVGIGISAYEKYGYFFQPKGSPTTSSPLPRLPAEIVLPIIAQCESGGRQFNPNGSVVTNKNTDGTIDRGKWQINSRHDEEVKRLGIDTMTEKGNERFARILYARNELRDWEASRHCWEPRLMALGHSPGLSPSSSIPTTDSTFVVKVRPDKPAEVVMPPGWMIVWWGDKSKFKSDAVWRGSDKVRVFVARTGVASAEIKIHRYYDPDPNWWRRR